MLPAKRMEELRGQAAYDAEMFAEQYSDRVYRQEMILASFGLYTSREDWDSREQYEMAKAYFVLNWKLTLQFIDITDSRCETCGDETGGPNLRFCAAHERQASHWEKIIKWGNNTVVPAAPKRRRVTEVM